MLGYVDISYTFVLTPILADVCTISLWVSHCVQDITDLPDPVPGSGENEIEHAYSLWFTQRTRGSVSTSSNYEENIKFIGSFCTVRNALIGTNSTPLSLYNLHTTRYTFNESTSINTLTLYFNP